MFLPDTLDIHNIGILEGFVRKCDSYLAFYVTNENLLKPKSTEKSIGYCSERTPSASANHKPNSHWLHININTGTIRVADDFNESNTVCVKYDYSGFKNSDISTFQLHNYGEHFEVLAKAIKDNSTAQNNCITGQCGNLFCVLLIDFFLVSLNFLLRIHAKCAVLLNYSTTVTYLNSNTRTLKWILMSLKEERKVSIRVGNAICSKLIDLALGSCAFYYFMRHEDDFVRFVETSTESIIHGLEQLLNSLMGSPVGLKLNYAFNSALGNFFLYHIMLWRAFLQTTGPIFYWGMRWLSLPAMFGLTYQAALFSDLVAFATLHVYCIYVYAAR